MTLGIGIVVWLGVGAFFCREVQLARERTDQMACLKALQASLQSSRLQLRRCTEDLFVLQAILSERNICSESELSRGRMRLIEAPSRQAQQRAIWQKCLHAEATLVLVDEGERKIH